MPERLLPSIGRSLRAVAALAALALTAGAVVACGGHSDSSASPATDLIAVVTGENVDALVGIDVLRKTVTRLVPIERNEAHLDVDGLVSAPPPLSVVLFDSTVSNPLVWTQPVGGDTVAVRVLDRATNEVHDVDAPPRGVLPFLYEGKLAWASVPGDGRPRLLISDGSFNLDLPGVPSFVATGPGTGRITVVVGPLNRRQRMFVIDIATNEATELPTESLVFGGVWADDKTLVASVVARAVPTIDDPANLEPDNRLLTWSLDGGPSSDPAGALLAGPTLMTDPYPRLVTGGNAMIVAASEVFDNPWVEAFTPGSTDPTLKVELGPSGFITAMAVSGTTLVVLQETHATFIDMASGDLTTVAVGGVTETRWVGR
jgi:hypothetical protein